MPGGSPNVSPGISQYSSLETVVSWLYTFVYFHDVKRKDLQTAPAVHRRCFVVAAAVISRVFVLLFVLSGLCLPCILDSRMNP